MTQPSAAPFAIIDPRYCSYPIDLAIVRKVLTLANGNFVVQDFNGSIIFQVKEILLTFVHERKLILDAAGNTIVTLRRKAMTAHSRWQVFRGESTDPKDLIFSAKTHSILYLKTKLDVFLAHNTEEKVCDFKVKGSFFERSCVIYKGDEDSATIVAQMQKKHTAQSILLGKDKFMVTVFPKMDYAFIVALIVILDDINHEAQE
ncbi:hypothetical protein GH714_003146 [Hevea brasiliensis]|uniref:Uncharacterized protein n=1 Tax=Hevea brasiliensis TaxID=3981 RepID=A0A6A6LZU3_HEVBR|nr:hypothetical protein GH714_003146 [Hevea brasiliensis]